MICSLLDSYIWGSMPDHTKIEVVYPGQPEIDGMVKVLRVETDARGVKSNVVVNEHDYQRPANPMTVRCTVRELRSRIIDILHASPKHPLAGSDNWRRKDFLEYGNRKSAMSCHTPAYVWRNILVRTGV